MSRLAAGGWRLRTESGRTNGCRGWLLAAQDRRGREPTGVAAGSLRAEHTGGGHGETPTASRRSPVVWNGCRAHPGAAGVPASMEFPSTEVPATGGHRSVDAGAHPGAEPWLSTAKPWYTLGDCALRRAPRTVGVAQGLERWTVAPEAGGSSPLTHPIPKYMEPSGFAAAKCCVAQLRWRIRAPRRPDRKARGGRMPGAFDR